MEEFEIYKERAKGFYENAKFSYEKGRYDVAIFNLEQAVQLYLKYLIGIKLGDFPKIHSLYFLLDEFGEAYDKKEEIEKFKKEEADRLNILSNAYINARYTPTIYTKEVLDNQFKFFDEFKKLLESLSSHELS